MKQQAVMGVDIGTTGCRAVIYRQDGSMLAGQSTEYPLYTPQAAWAEQNPHEIYDAFVHVVRGSMERSGLKPDELAGICFSSVMHSIIPVNKEGVPVHNMLIWADSRSQAYAEEVKSHYDFQSIYQRTGCPNHPMYLLYKIMWFKRERPELFSQIAKFIGIKEYICYRLLGKYVIDKSVATTTGLYNIHAGAWDREVLDIAGISGDMLSEVAPTTHAERGVIPETAAALGISTDTAIILGAADGIMSNIGSGAVDPGQVTAMIGTSGAVRGITDTPKVDSKMRTWCYHVTENHWVVGGSINNGGIALRWIRDKFAGVEQQVAEKAGLDIYDLLSKYAEEKHLGADGLVMLPLFSGERAPYYNANARGVLFGLNMNHGKRHLIRATMEGVLFSLANVFQALEEGVGKSHEIRASGSFTRSPFWVQMMADVFGRDITVPGEPEGAAFGAAFLGMAALGMVDDISRVHDLITVRNIVVPNQNNHERYRRLLEIYQRIYSNLQHEFEEIAQIQREWYDPCL